MKLDDDARNLAARGGQIVSFSLHGRMLTMGGSPLLSLDHTGRSLRASARSPAATGDASGRPNRVPVLAEPRRLKGLGPASTATSSRSGATDVGLRTSPRRSAAAQEHRGDLGAVTGEGFDLNRSEEQPDAPAHAQQSESSGAGGRVKSVAVIADGQLHGPRGVTGFDPRTPRLSVRCGVGERCLDDPVDRVLNSTRPFAQTNRELGVRRWSCGRGAGR